MRYLYLKTTGTALERISTSRYNETIITKKQMPDITCKYFRNFIKPQGTFINALTHFIERLGRLFLWRNSKVQI